MKRIGIFMVIGILLFAACKKQETQNDENNNTNTTNGGGDTPTTGLTINTGVACIDALAENMVKVNGGTFLMGAIDTDDDAWNNERPQHSVTVSDFYICKHEVTQALWQAVMGSTPTYDGGWSDKYGKGDTYPAYYISWEDCDTFLIKLNALTGLDFRMPTEAEWEYAARGGNRSLGYTYAGSNTVDSVAWYSVNSYDLGSSHADYGTHIVMQKLPNELGLYDMSGNVFEWCSDWYDENYYAASPVSNPQGPVIGSHRVIRGGSWTYYYRNSRISFRDFDMPGVKKNYIGLRLVLPVE